MPATTTPVDETVKILPAPLTPIVTFPLDVAISTLLEPLAILAPLVVIPVS